MTMQSLLDPEVQKFIREHERDDVRALALKKPKDPSWDYPCILDQIKSRQKARVKLPLWADHHPDIIFPSPGTLEQASSAATARYKAALVKGSSFADLTGGAGVDSCALTEHYKQGHIIDCDQNAADLIAHNLPLLCTSQPDLNVQCARAEEFIKTMPQLDLAIIDPQRRDGTQKGKFKFADCSPDILKLLPELLEKAQTVLIKTSPMLDIAQGIKELCHVQAVHIIEWKGDCKELVFILSKSAAKTPQITAAKIDDNGEILQALNFTQEEEQNASPKIAMPEKYLYEPGPAFQKSGAFGIMAQRFGLKKLHTNTHLYTGESLVSDFPGRVFEIEDQFPAKAGKTPLKQANIAVRNFPMSAPELHKKLKIKEGGEAYIFACTLANGSKTLLSTRKA